MKKIALYILLIASVVFTQSCNRYDIEEILTSRDDVSLTIKGEPVFIYNEDKCQLAYNIERNEYRAMTDDHSDYFVLRAHQVLNDINQEFTADLTYVVSGKPRTLKNLTFTIEKISNEAGLVWVWSKNEGIGAVVKLF